MSINDELTVEEHWFDDESIIEQSQCMIKAKDNIITVGASLVVAIPPGLRTTEIILEYEQLKTCLEHLEKDLEMCKAMGLKG